MANPTITLQNTDVAIKIAWTYPQDNGDSVKQYYIELRGKDTNWYDYNDTCDGTTA
jgi:uncharacterized protein (DUF2225 family)